MAHSWCTKSYYRLLEWLYLKELYSTDGELFGNSAKAGEVHTKVPETLARFPPEIQYVCDGLRWTYPAIVLKTCMSVTFTRARKFSVPFALNATLMAVAFCKFDMETVVNNGTSTSLASPVMLITLSAWKDIKFCPPGKSSVGSARACIKIDAVIFVMFEMTNGRNSCSQLLWTQWPCRTPQVENRHPAG
jgi:hypothetical protein